jgi:tetratricopeptide (TPR) repeat protein
MIHHVILNLSGPALGWDAETVYAVTSVGAGVGYCVMLHHALAILIPSFVYLYAATRNRPRAHRLRSILSEVSILLLMLTAIAGSYLLWGKSSSSVLIVPLSGNDIAQYTFFSWSHFVDFLNEQVLISPTAWIVVIIFAVVVLSTRDLRRAVRYRFLLLAGLLPTLFNLLLRPGLGGSRDWDLWSMGCLPYTVCAVLWIARGLGRENRFRYAAAVMLVVGIVHVAPWVAVNRSASLGLERFGLMLDDNPLRTGRRIAAARHELGSFYFSRCEFEEAADQIEKAVELTPGIARYWMSLGLIDVVTGRNDRAESRFRHAIALDPDFLSAHNNLGRLLLEQGRLGEAEAAFGRALVLDPDHASSNFNLGQIYQVHGDLERAAEAYRRAAEVEPSKITYWYYLAVTLEGIAGRDKEALDAWKEVAALAREDPALQEMLERALGQIKRLESK